MAYKIMIQGTMSNSGKSFLAAALCRIFAQDGYQTAPFKSQNMALNSYITQEGLEIGRAQAMQAEAAGIAPTADMNPILLKPTGRMGSQVIVNGEVYGNLSAMDYYRRKPEFVPAIREAFARLESLFDVIVLEGAGSPAEINLRENDIVNMGMAEMADAPVLLVGDIDRGGVFASLYGTVALLTPGERARIRGLVINKFRGDVNILKPGLRMIEELVHIPVLGVIPMEEIDLDDEDSLAGRLSNGGSGVQGDHCLDLAVIHLPHISNFTDFNAPGRRSGVSLRYVRRAGQLGKPDLIILPGTKNTMADLRWLRESGLEAVIYRLVEEEHVPVIGICGGYQMLGDTLSDPEGVEGKPGSFMRGMGLLAVDTCFAGTKTRTQIHGELSAASQMFAVGRSVPSVSETAQEGRPEGFGSLPIEGYEIHMGRTEMRDGGHVAVPMIRLDDGRWDGLERADGLVFGTYLHGFFDNEQVAETLFARLARGKGFEIGRESESLAEYKERQYDRLAKLVRENLDMEQVRSIMGMKGKQE